jgi:outer membrane lipoprotein SlyB
MFQYSLSCTTALWRNFVLWCAPFLIVAAAFAVSGCESQSTTPPEQPQIASTAAEPSQQPAPVDPAPATPTKVSSKAPPVRARPAPAPCTTCGVIASIQEVREKGEATGVGTGIGAVVGGVAGGVIGHQFGQGKGRDVATIGGAVAGAAGGGYAGREIERRQRAVVRWVVTVRMESGSRRQIVLDEQPAHEVGDPVRVVDGRILPG